MTSVIEQIEQRFARLSQQLEAGEIDEATFEREAEGLQFQDADGRIWALGARTGRWYVYQDGEWLTANPRRAEPPTPPVKSGASASAVGRWIGLILVGGGVVLCLALIVGGWLWWRGTWDVVPPTPVVVTERPGAPTFTPGAALVMVTSTPRPPTSTSTVTVPPPTATPTVPPTATDTPLPTQTPPPTATATPPPTATPTVEATATPTATASGTTASAAATAVTPGATAGTTAPPGTATATPTEPPPTATPRPRLAGRIVYPVYNSESAWYDIYLQPVTGGDRQWLVGAASQPAISADGQYLAFRSWQADDRGLRVMRLDGGDRRRVTDRLEDGLPDWTADGASLLFSSRRENDRYPRLFVVSASGGEVRTLQRDYKAVIGLAGRWLADGRIVYKASDGVAGLYLMAGDGSSPQELVGDASVALPSVSPDGRTIAFMSQRDGNWEIYRIAADGSGLRRLTNHPAQDGVPAWSPDGRWLAFVSDREGEWAMWAVDAQGGSLQKLFALGGAPGGIVRGEPDFSSRGWLEEQIQWIP
ncbi:MAG: hypothetical protein GX605_03170 [Chloroflexi bacterium]|nr:hypothetical protein [Chloroflexota bacterium]